MMDSVYTIPAIAQDLRQEENIIQIADTLEHLSRVIDDIFGRIDKRINDNIVRSRSIAGRIAVCATKVDKLTGTNKATKVFSSSKYPGMDCRKNYEGLFSDIDGALTMVRTDREIKSKPLITMDKEHQEKLEFYHVKISQPDARRALLESRPPKGLGPLPWNAPSIGCLLLHGTGETVYGATERAPGHARGQLPLVQATADAALDAAPVSMSSREKGTGKAAEPYMYSPGMGEVPDMDVPQDLPHLPGVAGDLQFLSESERAIAPSAALTVQPSETFPETEQPDAQFAQEVTPVSKAEVTKSVVLKQPEVVVKKVEEIVTVKKQGQVREASGAPPPPPMPPPLAPLLMAAPPPPPIPVPPPMQNLTEPDSGKKGTKAAPPTAKAVPPPAADKRADLMADIRNAGGLKKAKLRTTKTAEETKKAASSGGGDLMADLYANLSMRRKGISGNRSIMEALQDAISPPVSNADNVSHSSSSLSSSAEEDWN